MMTRKPSPKSVPDARWRGRLENARAFHQAARDALALAEPGQNANPILSSIAAAAIGYADALTAKVKQVIKQQDHAAALATLRLALGNRLPAAEVNRLGRILAAKDPAQYGGRRGRLDVAGHRLADLDALAQWAEAELAR